MHFSIKKYNLHDQKNFLHLDNNHKSYNLLVQKIIPRPYELVIISVFFFSYDSLFFRYNCTQNHTITNKNNEKDTGLSVALLISTDKILLTNSIVSWTTPCTSKREKN